MKRPMTRTCVAVAASILLVAHPARAVVTNVVDMAALLAVADNGAETCTNGWTLHNIGKYADPVLQLNSKDDWILSPDFGASIIRLECGVRCTANTTRRLAILDETTGGQVKEFALCAEGNKDETQSFDFADDEGLSQFRLKMNAPTGSSGNWGVGSLKVITADPIAAPTALAVVKTNTTSCVLEWVNGAGAVSNRVDVYRIEHGSGETSLCEVDFSTFSAGGNVVRMDASLPAMDPLLSGTNVYAAANTNGICQLGKTDALGIIRWAGIGDFSGVSLRVSAKRYPGDNDATTVAYELNDVTNEIATVTLADDFADYAVDLSKDVDGNDVPGGATILVGYFKTKTKRRVLIDSLSIVRRGSMEETLVDSRMFPATPGVSRHVLQGLVPNAEYRFEVSAQSGEGLLSSAISAEARLLAVVPGFGIILR